MSVTKVPTQAPESSVADVPRTPGDCTVDREPFVAALSALAVVLQEKPVTAAMNYARLVVEPGRTELHVFGKDVTAVVNVSTCVPVSGMNREGCILLPLLKTKELLSDLTAARVNLRADEDKVVIQWVGGRCVISTVEDTLPIPRSFEDEWDFYELDSHELYNGVTCAMWGMDPNDHRTALQGVSVRLRDRQLEFCGTDATQLSLYTVADVEVTNRPAQSGIISARGAQVLSKVLDWAYPNNSPSSPVQMALGNEFALFKIGGKANGGVVQVRLQEGRFPKYEKILETVGPHYQRTTISVPQLVTSLRQAVICLDGENVAVEMQLSPEESIFRAETPSVGRARVEVKFDQPPTAPANVRLDLRVLLRAIQHAPKSAMLEFAFCDAVSLVQFKFGQWVYALMPLVDPKSKGAKA